MTTRIFFVTDDFGAGTELFVHDGSGTHVLDVFPGSFSSFPSRLFNFNGTVLFQAFTSNPSRGQELWKSDGTSAGTVLVKDINAGSSDSGPEDFANLNGTVFFRATTTANGQELWKTDGTGPGTEQVAEINPGNGSSSASPISLLPVGNSLYFWANDGSHGNELWRYDGNTAFMLKDIRSGTANSQDSSTYFPIAALGNNVVFAANNGTAGEELWKSDGTPDGTQLLANIALDSSNPNVVIRSSSPSWFTTVGDNVFFVATNVIDNLGGGTGRELWKTDGTTTELVKDIVPGGVNDSGNPRLLTAVGNTLYFFANDGTNGSELWKSDGSPGGTTMVKNINPGNADGAPVVGFQLLKTPFVAKDGILYFWANDGQHGTEPWRSDGTENGTFMIKDVNLGPNGSILGDIPTLVPMFSVDGSVYFAANAGSGTGFWMTDGTEEGTVNLYTTTGFVREFLPVAGPAITANDFNGDGKADVLFSNEGAVFASNYEWQLNDRSLLGQGAIDLYDKAFNVQIIGDYDGDGKADLVFQNPNTGGVWEWRLDGFTILSQGAVDVGDPSFHLLGAGDLNGDGKDDLLLRNDAGFVYEWQMNGRVNTPQAVGPLDPNWHVQGTGDFNGDGKDDILLHYKNAGNAADPANGAFVVWQMNGNVIANTLGIERPDPSWQTLGTGDFNGDGIDDLAIRNVSNSGDNGAVWVYLLAGTVTSHGDGSKTLDILAQGAAGIADPAAFKLQQIGDLDGDGKDDILYRNDAGFFYSWDMNGTTIASEGLLQGAAQWADPSFTVVKPHWDLV